MCTHVGKQLKTKGLKILCAKLVVVYYLAYIFMGSQQRFHLSTSSQCSENKKRKKKMKNISLSVGMAKLEFHLVNLH
jgi:hypothetical protein